MRRARPTYPGSGLTAPGSALGSILTTMGFTLFLFAQLKTISIRPTFFESPQFLTRISPAGVIPCCSVLANK